LIEVVGSATDGDPARYPHHRRLNEPWLGQANGHAADVCVRDEDRDGVARSYTAWVAHRSRAVVQIEELQFLISGGGRPLTVDAGALDQLSVLAEVPQWIAVLTGAHAGPVDVRVACLEAAPTVEEDWEEVVEFSVATADVLGVVEVDGDPRLTITNDPGQYRLRLSRRGPEAGARRYSAGPRSKILEHFLIEVWPAPPTPPAVLRAVDPPPAAAPVVLEFEAAGREAAARIGRDLRRAVGARVLGGERGSIRVSYDFRERRRALYADFDPNMVDLWVTSYSDDEIVDDRGRSLQLAIHGGGRIFCKEIESVRPRLRTMTWDWHIPAYPPGHEAWAEMPSFLDPPTTVQIQFVEHNDPHDTAHTRITIEHTGLPVEWLDDMTAFWQWRLERGDKLLSHD
jgi:hypothetical protein